jgi:hypothetical protein|tara:strand:- start:325 stop:459 length:135 start_codon:yes stop_codon:yes gene_type:complete
MNYPMRLLGISMGVEKTIWSFYEFIAKKNSLLQMAENARESPKI